MLAVRFMKQYVIDDLERLIAEMAQHQAHRQHCSLAEATRQIRMLVAEAREEYHAAISPHGDDERGLCRSLLARRGLTAST
jgi:hypothetical protein